MNSTDRSSRKAETRERILDAAEQALRLRGLEEPTVGEVMAQAGLTVGGFYAHFDSKQSLMLEALGAVLGEQRALLRRSVDAPPGPQWRAQAARVYLSRSHRDAERDCCPLPAVISELVNAAPEFRQLLATHLERFVADMVGPEEAPAQARQRALADLALMIGAFSLARALGATPLSDELLAAARAAIR